MSFFLLIISGLLEVALVYFMTKSQGFKIISWTVLSLITVVLSLTTMSFAMNQLEAGIAYSIWVGIGSVGSIILGRFIFHDQIKPIQYVCLTLIIIAVIGLKVTSA